MKTRSREIDSLNDRIALKFDKHIRSSAAEAPTKFQSGRIILTTNFVASKLCEILQQSVLSDTETEPCGPFY